MTIYSNGWKTSRTYFKLRSCSLQENHLFSAQVPWQDYSLVHHLAICAGDQIQELWRFTVTQRGCKVFWNSWKQSWWDKFFQIGQIKIPLLTSWHHVFYNLIELFWEWSWPPYDKKISQSVIAKTSHTVQLNGETHMIWKGEWYNIKGYCRVYHWSTNS